MSKMRDYKKEFITLIREVSKEYKENSIPSLIAESLRDAEFEDMSNEAMLDCTIFQCKQYKKTIKKK